ncbi:MAG: hypothetical protein QXD43_01580 [Candidatus Aenigmatarchaeota archaeon]
MSQKNYKIPEPQTIEELSTVCYQAMYESNEEAKKHLNEIQKNYYSLNLNESEKSYIEKYFNSTFHIAKKMKKINRRNYVRKEKADFDKKVFMEEATINKNTYLKEIDKIKKYKMKGLSKERKIIKGGVTTIPPVVTAGSYFVLTNYAPKDIATAVSTAIGFGVFSAICLIDKLKTKKEEKINKDYYENKINIEKYYADRVKQIENDYIVEILKIEDDKESEAKKIISKEIKKLQKSFNACKSKESFDICKSIELTTL